jgi:hypothetical protein
MAAASGKMDLSLYTTGVTVIPVFWLALVVELRTFNLNDLFDEKLAEKLKNSPTNFDTIAAQDKRPPNVPLGVAKGIVVLALVIAAVGEVSGFDAISRGAPTWLARHSIVIAVWAMVLASGVWYLVRWRLEFIVSGFVKRYEKVVKGLERMPATSAEGRGDGQLGVRS